MLLQQLPPNAGEVVEEGYWEHLTALADTIKADELKQLAAEEILHRLYHEETYAYLIHTSELSLLMLA